MTGAEIRYPIVLKYSEYQTSARLRIEVAQVVEFLSFAEFRHRLE